MPTDTATLTEYGRPELPADAQARKGDVVALHLTTSTTYLHGPTRHRSRYVVGQVTRATRDGYIADVSWDGGRAGVHHPNDRRNRFRTPVVSSHLIPRRMLTTRARLDLIGATTGQEYETLEAVRAACSPYVDRGRGA